MSLMIAHRIYTDGTILDMVPDHVSGSLSAFTVNKRVGVYFTLQTAMGSVKSNQIGFTQSRLDFNLKV